MHFPSLDSAATPLDAYLFRANRAGPRPAVVFMHGCGGLLTKSGEVVPRELAWAERLNAEGITVLMIDSFTPRHQAKMCAPAQFNKTVSQVRPLDAYAGLMYLQDQDFIDPAHIALMGWSQGGGALLDAIRRGSNMRPSVAPAQDFRAAVAFYPARCSNTFQGRAWSSHIPLLLLIGESDVWTPLEPCRAIMENLTAGTGVTLQTYPGAYHDFDWPGMRVHAVPAFRTRSGVIPIEGTDPAARADALERVPAFLKHYLMP